MKFVAGDTEFLEGWFEDCVIHPEGCPDYVQIDGGEGGTGAAPSALIDYVGLPITLALPMVAGGAGTPWAGGPHPHHCLRQADHAGQGRLGDVHGGGFRVLRARIHVQPGLHPGDEVRHPATARPGVTSSVPKLIAGLDPTDKAARVARYAQQLREEVEIIAHSCGLTDPTGFRPRHVTEIERGVGGFRAAQGSD